MKMNQMANARNEFQGDAKRVLCVCSAGLLRSPTLANVLNKEFGYNTRAVGSCQEYALIHITSVLVYWANEIVFIEEENKQESEQYTSLEDENYFVLGIPDNFPYNDEVLKKILLSKYQEIVLDELEPVVTPYGETAEKNEYTYRELYLPEDLADAIYRKAEIETLVSVAPDVWIEMLVQDKDSRHREVIK